MSVTIETLVFCDGCGENHSGDDRSFSAAYIRNSRKAMGWIRKGSKDYCPECAKTHFAKWRPPKFAKPLDL